MQSAALLVLVAFALYLFSRVRTVTAGEGGATTTLLSEAVSAAGGAGDLVAIYQKYAAQLGLPWQLVQAIAQHESGENPDAVNESDNESIGLMQVLCRPDGRGGCTNRLNVAGWSDTTRDKLLDPDWNVWIGAQILASNIAAYGIPKGIAVYNAWDQHTAPALGPFKNQAYVDDVLRRAAALGFST